MKHPPALDVSKKIYALQHIDSGEFICLLQDGIDYLACFTDGDSALEFRSSLHLEEHVDLFSTTIGRSPFSHFWLDGENASLKEEVAR